MLSEKEFKDKLTAKLNLINQGWYDGDLKNSNKSADIVNDDLKIAIEIKDDVLYKSLIPPKDGRMVSQTIDITKKNRQYKNHIKLANEKFLNYKDYKSILILRTEIADRTSGTIDYIINGPQVFSKVNGQLQYAGRPSTFFGDHDNSTNEVGSVIFWGSSNIIYRKNINPNVNKNRFINKTRLQIIFGMKFT